MLDAETKRRINAVRGALVGQVPDPLGQVRHITAALMHRFMSDRDRVAVEQGGKPAFFVGPFAKFAWSKILDAKTGGHERVQLYREAVEKMADNKNLPEVFREMFRGAVVAFNDPQTLALFLREVDAIPARGSEDLGNAFEHILSILGTQGQAGQFRTPRHIIEFIVEVVAPEIDERILDPACGSAGFLIAAHKRILRRNSAAFDPENHKFAFAGNGENAADAVYADGQFRGDLLRPAQRNQLAADIQGYDISPDMTRLSLVNMFLHGIRAPKIHAYDTLARQDKWDDDFEVILANPPFMSPRGGVQPHGRFSIRSNRSEVLFADYILRHLTSKGRAGIIVPEGIIFQSQNAHKTLRKNLVENGLRAVVSLPGGIFQPYSGVKTSILFLDRAREGDEILFVRVENDGYDLGAQRRRIEKNDLPAAFELLRDWANGMKTPDSPLAHLWVKRDAIAADGEYNLTAERHRQTSVQSGTKWPRAKLGEVCEVAGEYGSASRKAKYDGKVRYVRISDIDEEGNLKRDEFVSPSRIEPQYFLRPGDVLFARSGSVGRAYLHRAADGSHQFAGYLIRYRVKPDIVDPAFLFYLTMSEHWREWIRKQSKTGTLTNINARQFSSFEFPLPPLEFQKALAAELDGYQRVANGARQVAENWRPRIPENADWPLVKLGEIAKIVAGQSPDGNTYNKKAEGIPFYQGKKEFTDMHLGAPTMWTTQAGTIAKKGDILMSVRAPVGPVNIGGGKICFGRGLAAIRANAKKADQLFLFYALRSMEKNIRGNEGATIASITRKGIEEIPIPLPSLAIQREIASSLDAEREKVESCRALAESHAEKIRSRVGAVWGE